MDPEEWIGVITQAFEVMADAAYRYEGTVAQLLGDGLLAFFGAPIAHEDDPERAVRAGLDMVREIEALGEQLGLELRIRVGINTGLVIVGNVGNDLRYEYTAIGDAVNVASRMQSSATPGSVLITDDTHRFVQRQVEVVDLGSIELRGKTEPVRAYEVVGLSATDGRVRGVPGLDSPTVGRDAEVEQLRRSLDVVRAGRGRAALILGEPGLGKTRLVRELASASDGTVAWVEGLCLSYGERIPFGLVLALVRSLAGVSARASDEHLEEALEQRAHELLGDDADEQLRYIRHLLGLPLPAADADALGRLDPARLHSAYVDALRRLLAASAERERPVALVCEDVHWADTASVETLRPLLPLVRDVPLLFLMTSRPDRDAPGWQLVTEARDVFGEALTELSLSPLSADDSRTLVAHLLRIEALPQDLRRLILSKGEGNPFFIEEVIRMLVERGAIERRGEDWVAVETIEQVEIPATLHGLLLARIDRLPEDAKRALRVASTIGRRFSPTLLEEVVRGEEGVARELASLEASGLVRLAETGRELEYEFRHALVHEAAYDSLLKQERRLLHRAVGEALERTDSADPAVLALHFERAGDDARAMRYLIEAGDHAVARYANREARGLYDRAAALLDRRDPGDPEALRLRVEVGVSRARSGFTTISLAEEIERLQRLLPEAEALGDRALEARVHLWLARNRSFAEGFHSEELRRSVEQVRRLAEETDDDYLRAQPLAIEGMAAFQAGRFRDAIHGLGSTVPLLERWGDFGDASWYAGATALAYAYLGEFAPADEWLAVVRRLAETSGDPNAMLDADIFAGTVEGQKGNLETGIELAGRGAVRAYEVGNMMCEVAANFQMGDQYLRRGALDDAVPVLERSNELARQCGAIGFATVSGGWASAARGRLGETDAGLAGLDEALEQARALGDGFGEAGILDHRAVVRSQTPEPDWGAVVADFDASIELYERLETQPALARALRNYGAALERTGRVEEAGEKLARSMALFAELDLTAA